MHELTSLLPTPAHLHWKFYTFSPLSGRTVPMCGLTAERNSLYCAKLVLDRSYKNIFKKTIIFLPFLLCLFYSLSRSKISWPLCCWFVRWLDEPPLPTTCWTDHRFHAPTTCAAFLSPRLHYTDWLKRSPRWTGGGTDGGGGYKIRILQSTKIKLTNKQTYVHTLQRNITRTHIRTRKYYK